MKMFLVLLAALIMATNASALTTEQRLKALEKRVTELESKQRNSLSFVKVPHGYELDTARFRMIIHHDGSLSVQSEGTLTGEFEAIRLASESVAIQSNRDLLLSSGREFTLNSGMGMQLKFNRGDFLLKNGRVSTFKFSSLGDLTFKTDRKFTVRAKKILHKQIIP